MYAVIFEVHPAEGGVEEYLEIADKISSLLQQQKGFISVERFQSATEENKGLSLSFWESEAAIEGWRNQLPHRSGQKRGKGELFNDYRIRVAKVVRDYTNTDRTETPKDSVQALG